MSIPIGFSSRQKSNQDIEIFASSNPSANGHRSGNPASKKRFLCCFSFNSMDDEERDANASLDPKINASSNLPPKVAAKSQEENLSRWSHPVNESALSAAFASVKLSPVRTANGLSDQGSAVYHGFDAATTAAETAQNDHAAVRTSRLRPLSPTSPPAARRGEDFSLSASLLTISRPSNGCSPADPSPAGSPQHNSPLGALVPRPPPRAAPPPPPLPPTPLAEGRAAEKRHSRGKC